MDLRHLGGTWPRKLTAKEEQSIFVNPGQKDAATAACPPDKNELAALAAIEVAEQEYRSAVEAFGKVQDQRAPRAHITPRGELEFLNTQGPPEVYEQARARVDEASENVRRCRVRWTEECQKRAARIAAWRLKNPDK